MGNIQRTLKTQQYENKQTKQEEKSQSTRCQNTSMRHGIWSPGYLFSYWKERQIIVIQSSENSSCFRFFWNIGKHTGVTEKEIPEEYQYLQARRK